MQLGQMTSSVGFDHDGRPDPRPSADSVSGLTTAESPFWAIYFTNGSEARALAIHSTGLIEPLRYENNQWTGFGGRVIP